MGDVLTMSEIVKIVICFCIAVLTFPFVIKISNFLGEVVCDMVKKIVGNYKSQWEECIDIVKGWFDAK